MKTLRPYVGLLLILAITSFAFATTQETTKFRVKADVTYNCWDGSSRTQFFLDTKAKCAVKQENSVLTDEVISVLVSKPSSGNPTDRIGAWDKSFLFRGREFFVNIGFSKSAAFSPKPVRVSIRIGEAANVAQSRRVNLNGRSVESMPEAVLIYRSDSKPDDYSFSVSVEPAAQ